MFATHHKVGRGCTQIREYLNSGQVAKRREAEQKLEWEKKCQEFLNQIPTGQIYEAGAVIFCEKNDPAKPMATYCVLQPEYLEYPNLPIWRLSSRTKKGLKCFFTKRSRDLILATRVGLVDNGGLVALNGEIRILGRATSGKSLHVELSDSARLV